jgi:hypothetical protein
MLVQNHLVLFLLRGSSIAIMAAACGQPSLLDLLFALLFIELFLPFVKCEGASSPNTFFSDETALFFFPAPIWQALHF